ncbi:Microfibrillar-associated protein 1 [Allomyces javanicus]|nr:Microfibrillar-associated protein 1 [Allomyces javanicus]
MSSRIAAVPAVNRAGQATLAPTKVQRYWRGKAPANVHESDDDDDDQDVEDHSNSNDDDDQRPFRAATGLSFGRRLDLDAPTASAPAAPVIHVDATADRRLQRLQQAAQGGRTRRRSSDDEDERADSHRSRAPVVVERTRRRRMSDSEEDEADRTQDVRARRRHEPEPVVSEKMDVSEDEESDESSEEESESEEEAPAPMPRLKPVFVPKHKRVTTPAPVDPAVEDDDAAYTRTKEQRRLESRALLEAEIKRELAAAAAATQSTLDVDDTDGLDPDAEYAAWEERELARLRRSADERRAYEQELAERERFANMTAEEREEYARQVQLEKEAAQKDKPKIKFLQKYYHKGAFYLDEGRDLLDRNYNEATGDDMVNREALPEVLQRRNFGKSGQSKWTHLSKEDTSSRDAAWFADRDLVARYDRKRGGMGDIDQPYKRRRG